MTSARAELRLDRAASRIWIGERSFGLTPRELELMVVLFDRRGQLVRRDELERDVWGFAPTTQSEAVPVMVRSIRRRMGASREQLRTVRGEGWILERAPTVAKPSHTTPYVPRLELLTDLKDRIAAGYTCIGLVGPPGCGKSRFLCQFATSNQHIRLDESQLDRVDATLAAALATGDNVEAIALALRDRENVVICVDFGVHLPKQEVMTRLAALDCAVVYAARHESGQRGESIISTHGMSTSAALTLLRHRAAARSVNAHVDDASLVEVTEAVGLHPGVLELLAQRPEGILEALKRWSDGVSLDGDPTEEFAMRAVRLVPALRELLCQLAFCEAGWSAEDLRRGFGSDGVRDALQLGSDGFLYPREGRWIVPAWVRRKLTPQCPADALHRRAVELQAKMDLEPALAIAACRPLITAWIASLEHSTLTAAVDIADLVVRFARGAGPRHRLEAVLSEAARVHPDSELVRTFRDYNRGIPPALETLTRLGPPQPDVSGLWLCEMWAFCPGGRNKITPELLDAWPPALRVRGRVMQLGAALRLEGAAPEMSLLVEFQNSPTNHINLDMMLARRMMSSGDAAVASRRLDRIARTLWSWGMREHWSRAVLLFADATALDTPRDALERLADARQYFESEGGDVTVVFVAMRQALIALSIGDPAGAIAFVEDIDCPFPAPNVLISGILRIASAWLGRASAIDHLQKFEIGRLDVMGFDIATEWTAIHRAFGAELAGQAVTPIPETDAMEQLVLLRLLHEGLHELRRTPPTRHTHEDSRPKTHR